MKHPLVVFVAKKEYDNLGIGYMAAVLSEAGYKTREIDFLEDKKSILKVLKKLKPTIVGFSVIYQYHIDQFKELVGFLRKGGIQCHFTAGGHYASIKFEELFELIPSLDSIVRFEGEYTILELTRAVCSGTDWKNTDSIAYKGENKIVTNPLRPLENDLDKFPYPIRSPLKEYAFNKKFATILAGRGCVHNCSFCNINEFYRHHKGPVKRIRKPAGVLKEMDYLFHKKKCSVFLFQDDDFPVKSNRGSVWVEKFCKGLKHKGLRDKIMWKINCRPDEVEKETFAMMNKNGLFLVFIGIEDGTDEGLERLNKHMNVERSLRGIKILKKLRIGFDFGFMLFQPSTTYISLYDNLEFLRQICGDGYTPVTFLKMMPYYETRVEKELIAEGRIKGEPGYRDYDFPEDSMNHYYEFITECFMEWIRYPDGLVNISKWVRNYFMVYERYYEPTSRFSKLYIDFTKTVSASNLYLLDTMRELAMIFESKRYENDKMNILETYRKISYSQHKKYKRQVKKTVSRLLRLVTNQQILKYL